MERENLEKIRGNLHQLVTHTICTAPFLEFFAEKNVFDISDIDAIKAKRGETEQASEFYNIVQTRANSYPVLIQGLRASKQSDIIAILEEGVIPPGLNERSRVRKLLYESAEGSARQESKLPIPRSNVRFNISSPVELFTGRTEEMEKLHELVQRSGGMAQPTVISQMSAISGLGGIGKTQLARQYVKEHGKDFDGNCIWLHSETARGLLESFRTLAKDKLEITTKDANGTEKDVSTVVEEVYKYFEKSKSLFIFDNAEKTPWLRKFLPKNTKSTHAIILTSRNKEWDKGIEVIELTELPEADAVAMVKQGLGLEEDDDSQNRIILKLVRKLQCFPLALQQAISYIQVQQELGNYPVESYLEDFEKRQQETLSFGEEDEFHCQLFNDYAMTTFTTWKMTVDKIGENKVNGGMALRILYAMAHLSPDVIKRDLFLRLSNVTSTNLGDSSEKGVADKVKAGVRLLVKFSMVRAEDKQRLLSIHRLVQKVTRTELSRLHKSIDALEDASQIIVQKSEDPIEEHWEHSMAISAHVAKTANTHYQFGNSLEYIIKLIEFCRQPHRKLGNETEKLLYRLYKLTEQHLGGIMANVLPWMFNALQTSGDSIESQSDRLATAIMGGNGTGILTEFLQLFENVGDKHDTFHGLFRDMYRGDPGLVPLAFLNPSLSQPKQGGTGEVLQSGSNSLLTNVMENVMKDGGGSFDCLHKLFKIYYESEMFQESLELFRNLFPTVESMTEEMFTLFTAHLAEVLQNLGSNEETAGLVDDVYTVLKDVHELELQLDIDLVLD